MKKILVLALVFIFIITTIIAIYKKVKKPGYTTEKVTKNDIVEVVTESGTIATNGKVDIYSPTTGVIEQVFVSNNDTVSEKQALFTVKSSATDQEKQATYSDYLTAKSSLESARETLHTLQSEMFSVWDTYKNLAENDTYENDDGTPKNEQRTLPEFHVAEKNWLAAEALYKNQQNVISQTQAKVSSTQLAYQATQNATVKSPISGVVSNVSIIPGSSVKINTALAPTTPVLSIGNFSTTEILLSLNEDDILKIKEDQTAEISVDAVDNKTYKGIVRRLDSIGTDVSGVIRYNVYIEITDPDEDLRPGMSVDADIITDRLENVLSVPNSAVKPYKGGKAVRAPGKKKGDITFVPVQIGIRGDKKTQITKGLSEGQTIITALSNEEARKSGPFGL